jgi:hypothetical protein
MLEANVAARNEERPRVAAVHDRRLTRQRIDAVLNRAHLFE